MNPISTVISSSSAIYEQLPSINRMTRNARDLAIPIVAIAALSNIPTVTGGPVTYAACLATCMAGFMGILPACLALCAPALAAPTP